MKIIAALLITIFSFGCISVRQCKHCTFSKGVISSSKSNKQIVLPHWNDSVLVFVNNATLKRDTFYVVKRILKEVEKASFQIENSSKDYFEVGLSLKRKKDNETFRLYFGQYTCVDDVLSLNISVFDFWDWVALKNNKPSSHTINKKIETLTVGERTYNNFWVFKPNAEGFPNALEKDIQTIYWDEVLGLIRYESNSTGVWSLEAVL